MRDLDRGPGRHQFVEDADRVLDRDAEDAGERGRGEHGRRRQKLLDMTRAYAIEKLDESSERERIARRHAEYYRGLFERAEREVPARPPGEWLADYALEIGNLRAALNWAFSPDSDASIGVLLTAAAVSLWRRLSLLDECRSRARQALDALATARNHDPYAEMKLYAALGAFTTKVTEIGAAFMNALAIAESRGDPEYQLRALGAYISFMPRAFDFVPRSDLCKSSMIWQRVGLTLALSCSANT
jgi:hypothetical protein